MEDNIALRMINEKIDTETSFFLESLSQEIIDQGGVLRIQPGVTVKCYLGELVSLGIIDYSVVEEETCFTPTGICNIPSAWKLRGENPFITAQDQDFG